MRKEIGHIGLRKDLAVVMFVLASGCTGVASTPRSDGTQAPSPAGTGNVPGAPSGTGSGPGMGLGGVGGMITSGTGATTVSGGAGAGPGAAVVNGKVVGLWDNLTPTTTLDVGRVSLRRLNIPEYDNTLRDLLGVMGTPATSKKYMFPEDQTNQQFDTNGQTLVYSDLLFSQILSATQGLVDDFLARPATDPIRTRILLCAPTLATMATCMPMILKPFMTSAFRRPATDAEVAAVVTLATSIATAHADPIPGLSAALRSVLLSPNFLFRPELSVPGGSKAVTKINDYELATRLSYFIGSTMPDTQLMAAAAAGKLVPAAADYNSQVDRLLADPVRLKGFVDNFAGRWLSLSDTALVAPDEPALMANFDDTFRLAMPQETTSFFSSLVTDKQPLPTLLTADFTFVNARLAKQYGLTAPAGTGLARVSLTGNTQRMGFLTQAAFLTITSLSIRTSPVRRGVWVLENLLCDGTAAPPPGIPELPAEGTGTVRQVLETHRAQVFCASCHNLIDPIGLALEGYDAVGAYRTKDNGNPIDSTSTLIDGTKISGAIELANLVAKDPRLTRCLTKQMMTFGVGRIFDNDQVNRTDRAYIMGLADPLAKANATWPDLVRAVATSEAFRTNRGEGP